MPGDRHEIDVLLVHIDGDLADRLCGVGMENDAALVTQLADFGDRLYHSDFVIRGHDGDKDSLVVHGAIELIKIDQAILLHRKIGDPIAILLQSFAGVEHGLVLGNSCNDVVALFAIHLSYAFDREVVALRCARSKNDFFRCRADQLGDSLASGFHALFARPAEGVIAAGGIAKLFHKIRQHLFQHPRIHGGGGMVIHIDRQLNSLRNGVLRDWKLLGGFHIGAHKCFSYLFVKSWLNALTLKLWKSCYTIVTNSAGLITASPAGSGSSLICGNLMSFSTASMLSFTLRSGSRMLQRSL